MKFNLSTQSDFARRAELELNRGKIQTPAFMPVGTNGTVKGMTVEDLESTNSEIILGNTFHLMLRPGDEVIRDLGGLHQFSNWKMELSFHLLMMESEFLCHQRTQFKFNKILDQIL